MSSSQFTRTLTRKRMKAHKAILFWLFTAMCSIARGSGVTDLSLGNFDDFVGNHTVVMVEFFASWCQVCKDLEPLYEATAFMLDSSKDIKFARVDCAVESDLCETYETPIFPTIRVFKGRNSHEIYNGPRESTEMIEFVERRYHPAFTPLTKTTMEEFKNGNDVTIIGYWAAEDHSSNKTFEAVATKLIDEYVFGATNDADLAEAEGISQPSLILYKNFDEGRVIFNGSFNEKKIISFIREVSTPLIGELDKLSARQYFDQSTLPFAGIFVDTATDRDELVKTIRPLAQRHKTKLRFATVNASEHVRFTAAFNFKSYPNLAIMDKQRQKFPIQQDIKITKDLVSQWVEDYLAGKLEPYVKSQPLPEDSDNLVSSVVRNNFRSIVLDNDKDVLLKFYAPWCSHCKRLAPDYEKLAQIYSQHDSKVKFAKVDATANDIPEHIITNYPTIKIFPAKTKNLPVQYLGNFTIEDLTKFIQDNSVNKVDITNGVSEGHVATDKYRQTVIGEALIPDLTGGLKLSHKDEL